MPSIGRIPHIRQNLNVQTEKEVLNSLGRGVKFLDKYKTMMGEKQDIVLNAIGTGIVAPIVIKNNPLSKTDEKTKSYSAIRQTMMAVISVIVQCGVVIPLDKYIDKMINSGDLGEKFTKNHPENVAALKRILPLGVAFITIPLSCMILNKIFPPFIKRFFPKLENANNQKNKIISPKTETLEEFEKRIKCI